MIINKIEFNEGDLIKIIDYSDNKFVGFARKPYWFARLFGHKIALSISKTKSIGESITREAYPFREQQIKGIEIIE